MYLWIKAIHLIAMVTWFAAMFYLPRLFVYHAQARDTGDQQAMAYFTTMERKLYRGIMMPSMIAVLIFGAGCCIWPRLAQPGVDACKAATDRVVDCLSSCLLNLF